MLTFSAASAGDGQGAAKRDPPIRARWGCHLAKLGLFFMVVRLPADRPLLRVLISFSPEDQELKEQLVRHLQVLVRFAGLDLWTADQVRAGDDWPHEVEAALDRADMALLLVSADFLASKLLQDVDVPKLFQRREQGGLKVIPVLLRSCLWQAHPWLGTLMPLPASKQAIASFQGDDRDRVLTEVAAEIARHIGSASARVAARDLRVVDVKPEITADLLARAVNGDRLEAGLLLDYVHGWASSVLGRRHAQCADDCANDAFAKIVLAFRQGSFHNAAPSSLSSCVTKIIVRSTIDFVRHTEAVSGRWDYDLNVDEVVATEYSEPEARMDMVRAGEFVKKWLDRLDPMNRALFLMRVDQELDFGEIARSMGIPVASTRIRWIRLLSQLRYDLGIAGLGSSP